jgi:hypothetical protein
LSRTAGRALVALGVGSLILALGVIAVVALSQGRMLGVWSGGAIVLVLLLVAALMLPFGLAVSWRRF